MKSKYHTHAANALTCSASRCQFSKITHNDIPTGNGIFAHTILIPALININLYTIMKLKITFETVAELNEVRDMLDQASVASYPPYRLDDSNLQWHRPTLVAVGTPNIISHVQHYVLKGRSVKMEQEKGY